MTLRKITIDNSVKFMPQSEQIKNSKPNTIKNNSNLERQNKTISQNNKKLIKNLVGGGFAILNGIMNCYFF